MPQNSRTLVYDQLITTTWYDVRKDIIDGVFQITPFWDKMVQNGKVRKKVPDGTHFEIPFRYAKMDQNFQYFGRGAQFGVAEKETLTRLYYDVKNFGTSMVRFWDDEQKQRGKAKIISWVDELVMNTKESLKDQLAQDTLVTSNDPQAIHSLQELISTTPAVGSIGGLTRASHTVLQNNAYNMTGLTIATNLLNYMRTAYNDCSKLRMGGRQTPDICITTQTVYEEIEKLAEALRVFDTNKNDRMNFGFGELMYKGMEIFWDPQCPEGTLYMLNTSDLEFLYDPGVWFEMGEWRYLDKSLDRWAPILCRGQMIAKQFPKHAVLYNIGA